MSSFQIVIDTDLDGGSEQYQRFLDAMGTRVDLSEHDGYMAGLSKTGRTGTHSIYTVFNTHQIMLHVSTLLPYSASDTQHIERKRHLGNDIINIVFLDGADHFDPGAIRTHFTHVFIVVRPEVFMRNGRLTNGFRVSIASRTDVPEFGPALPDPPLFADMTALRAYILAKAVNGEHCSYKAPRFSIPTKRTYTALIADIVADFGKKKKASATSQSALNKQDDDKVQWRGGSESDGLSAGNSVLKLEKKMTQMIKSEPNL